MLYPVELRARKVWSSGRGRGIRTPDILLPKQARYQTALYPVMPNRESPVQRARNDIPGIRGGQAEVFAAGFAPWRPEAVPTALGFPSERSSAAMAA